MSAGQSASGAGTWRELGGRGVAPLKDSHQANTVGLCERSLLGAAHQLAGDGTCGTCPRTRRDCWFPDCMPLPGDDARSRQADAAPGGIRWEVYAAKCAGVLL